MCYWKGTGSKVEEMRSLRRSSSPGRVACGGKCKLEEGSINQAINHPPRSCRVVTGGAQEEQAAGMLGMLWEPCSMTSLPKPTGWR